MRVTPNCDPAGYIVISNASGSQLEPDVAFGGGNYLVVWSDGRNTPSFNIYSSRVTTAGVVTDPSGVLVGPNDTIYRSYPSIAFNGSRFFAVWISARTPSSITGRFIGTNGVPAETVRVYTSTYAVMPTRIAFDGTNFLVAWVELSSPPAVKAQRVSASGSLVGTPITIGTTASIKGSFGMCFDGTNYLIVWPNAQIWGQKVATNGTLVGPAFRISTSSNAQANCDVVAGANNRYLNLWSETVASFFDIYANLDVPINRVAEQSGNRIARNAKATIVRDMIAVDGTQGKLMRLYDASGREVATTITGGLDCRGLKSGVYFVQLPDGRQTKVIKID